MENKFRETITILKNWANLKGQDNCWYHPEILKELCDIWNIPINNNSQLPPRNEFEKGCKSYQDKIYGK